MNEHPTNPRLSVNWNVVKDWKEGKRYESTITAAEAHDYIEACSDKEFGVLTWIKKQW